MHQYAFADDQLIEARRVDDDIDDVDDSALHISPLDRRLALMVQDMAAFAPDGATDQGMDPRRYEQRPVDFMLDTINQNKPLNDRSGRQDSTP